ncbi:MAG TPA: aspartate 1-decarboxylase [Solirubrobacterales bacterium]|nr:aspartate 1-decarboxylase [Solirubrobacterales bacterium]
MRRRMLKSKIHRATVTDCNLNYVGSISVDEQLLEAADILPFEQVAVVNINTGARFETYAMADSAGSGSMRLNGAAARLAEQGDKIIVFSYAEYAPEELAGFTPRVVLVNGANRTTTEG